MLNDLPLRLSTLSISIRQNAGISSQCHKQGSKIKYIQIAAEKLKLSLMQMELFST
jgi:hypothetical protein